MAEDRVRDLERELRDARAACEEALRRASDVFYEIVSAFSAEDLLAKDRGHSNQRLMETLRDHLRTPEQIRKIAADGFELCVRALAAMGASDVMIHECGERDMEHW